jgi:hypothetical protein
MRRSANCCGGVVPRADDDAAWISTSGGSATREWTLPKKRTLERHIVRWCALASIFVCAVLIAVILTMIFTPADGPVPARRAAISASVIPVTITATITSLSAISVIAARGLALPVLVIAVSAASVAVAAAQHE